MAAYRLYAMAARRQHSVPPMPMKKKNWAAQPTKEIVFCCLKKLQSILGTMEDVYEMSTKDKFPRKNTWENGGMTPSWSRQWGPGSKPESWSRSPETTQRGLWMLWKSQKDETGCHADIPSHGHGSSLCCQQSPKGRFLGSENPGEEKPLFCHGIIASPSHKRHGKANVQHLPYAEFLSTAFIGSFMESIVIPILTHYSCKTDSSRMAFLHCLDHDLHCQCHHFTEGSYW